MAKKLVLFDVDHTLLDVVGAHRRVFSSAFKKVLGLDVDPESLKRCSGYTDLQIINEFAALSERGKEPETVPKIIREMIREFRNQDLRDSLLLEGIPELLSEMKKKEDIIIGLLTGNIEEIAYTKLRHFGIDEYFILGGFGHSSAIRSELVDIAIKKAEEQYEKIKKSDVFIIGDTVYDIKAAKEAGVKVIAVATGYYSYEQLKEKEPDYIFYDLKDSDKIVRVIHPDT